MFRFKRFIHFCFHHRNKLIYTDPKAKLTQAEEQDLIDDWTKLKEEQVELKKQITILKYELVVKNSEVELAHAKWKSWQVKNGVTTKYEENDDE